MIHQQKTRDTMRELTAQGYTIIEGNNPYLPRRKKYAGYDIVRIAQTNSRYHGKSINTVFAIRVRRAL